MLPPLDIPALFGHWLLDGDKLVCRLPRKTVSVQAPQRLVSRVMELCDGSRSWADMLAAVAAEWDSAAIQGFLLGLVKEGVLVESSTLLAHWSDIAQVPTALPVTASDAEIAQLPRIAEGRLLPGTGRWMPEVATGTDPLAGLLAQRQSSRTFADEALSVDALCSILWAAQGVTRASTAGTGHLHRTIASGGNMHSTRWFAAVLQPLRDGAHELERGWYEARFHVGGGCTLERLQNDDKVAWHCLRDPRVLAYASALVIPVCDISVPGKKYGNRGTFYALIEAGQALQNAQLMAVSMGAAAMVRGDTVAAIALDMLREPARLAPDSVVACGLVVGAKPSTEQVQRREGDDWLQVAPNLFPRAATQRPGLPPSFAFAAGPQASGREGVGSSGRSDDPRLALAKVEAEAWERLAWSEPCNLQEGRRADFVAAIDPTELIAYSAGQYRSQDFPCLPFSESRAYLWAAGFDVDTGNGAFIPADCAYASSAVPEKFQRQALTNASTSGMAAWPTIEGAVCRAVLELVERDAFAHAWLAGGAPALHADSLPANARARIARLEADGFRVIASHLETPWAAAVGIFAQSATMPFTAITACADFDAETALAKALDEMEGRIGHAQRFPAESIAAAGKVHSIRAIEHYYRAKRFYRNADFFVQAQASRDFRDLAARGPRDWAQMQACLAAGGHRVVALDMTPPGAAIAQGRVLLKVARAFIPGLIPIWFQYGLQPAGMPRFQQAVASDGRGGTRRTSRFIHPFT